MLIAEKRTNVNCTFCANYSSLQKPTNLQIVCSAPRCARPNMSQKPPKLSNRNRQIFDLKTKLKTNPTNRLSFMQLQSWGMVMNVKLCRRCLLILNSPFKFFGSPLFPDRKKVSKHSTFFRQVATISSWKTQSSISFIDANQNSKDLFCLLIDLTNFFHRRRSRNW